MDEPPPSSRLERWKAAFARHHKQTYIGMAMGDSTPDSWAKIHASEFDSAKKISDFIGMLMRAGFAFLAFLYFLHAAPNAEYAVLRIVLGFCTSFSFGLYVWLIWRLNGVVLVHFLKDTAHWKHRANKIAFTLVGMVFSFSAMYGISQLAYAIATAGNLIR